jgi:ATP-binding cassette subfamily F protein 3
MTLGYLRQEAMEAFAGHEHSVETEMLTVFAGLREKAAALEALGAQLASGAADDALLERYGQVQVEFETGGGYEYERRIDEVLNGLGLHDDRHTPIEHLSGGQKTRALLARLLLERPDLLILDEPTNHLDIDAVAWLEGVLHDWPGAILVASHDRYFLDRVVDRIWEMTPDHMETYRGSYSAYVQQRQERWDRRHEEFDAEVERLQRDLEIIRRYFAWRKFDEAHGRLKRLGRELMAIEQFGVLGARGKAWSELGLRSAREMSLEEAHARIKAIKPLRDRPPHLHLHLPPARRSGHMVLETAGLEVGYPGNSLFRTGALRVEREDRVAIIGPNGAGKTTVLRTLLGQLPALRGTTELGHNVTVGYFAQAHDALKGDRTVLETLMAEGMRTEGEARNHLARYLFRGDDVYKPVSALSGGERAKLALSILSLQGVNLLLLDEPTNHLDIPAQEVLQEGLEAFDGTMLIVSHDRYLIADLATHIWEIRDGRLQVFKGTYAEYVARSPEPAGSRHEKPDAQSGKRPVKPEREERRRARMVASLEESIARAEAEMADYSRKLAAGSADFVEVARWADTYQTLQAQLRVLMDEWTALASEQ